MRMAILFKHLNIINEMRIKFMIKESYSCKHKAQYYETDQMGIVHHSNYIRWFEEARVDFLDAIGYSYKKLESEGIISPVIEINCKYKSMVHFGDEVIITPSIKEFNGVKLTISYEIKDACTGELRSFGTSSHCFLGKDGLPVKLKKNYPDFYERLLNLVI